MDDSLIFLILGMAAVTYIPRLVPFVFFKNQRLSFRVNAFLHAIPATGIGALIIPDGFFATPDFPLAALAGMGFALVCGWFRGGIILPVLGAVGAACLVLQFGAGL